ncbi:hypothetical protein K435DRAFT_352256 [Dendrothele bispora CBS 962.96]|uniref:Uncharacterized protein n=1 Tax=Dendrothele bispora (strain CBS 962.96) TaxID=1314807 RepID=A0A4S8MJ13_DENBC|nr:hypothetical protein K435DRAFT_352256 [Dendrothele bispora CBS 962.96]
MPSVALEMFWLQRHRLFLDGLKHPGPALWPTAYQQRGRRGGGRRLLTSFACKRALCFPDIPPRPLIAVPSVMSFFPSDPSVTGRNQRCTRSPGPCPLKFSSSGSGYIYRTRLIQCQLTPIQSLTFIWLLETIFWPPCVQEHCTCRYLPTQQKKP